MKKGDPEVALSAQASPQGLALGVRSLGSRLLARLRFQTGQLS